MKPTGHVLLIVSAMTFGTTACSSWTAPSGTGGDADNSPVTTCAPLGTSCANGEVCCIGACSVAGLCESGVVGCGAPDAPCNDNLDCCLNRCENNVCSADGCLDTGEICNSPAECCTATCTGGLCAPLTPGGCKVVGQACGDGSECCSTNCPGGVCTVQSGCRSTDDLCFSDLDCCSFVCSKNDGSPGACILPPGGCGQGGMPCTGNSTCCTRVCADPGTGVDVCLPASGCRMTGLACLDDQSCCGGGTNPNGSVVCDRLEAGDAFGRCDNGTSCNPVGNICGASFPLPDGSSYSVNASQNCCDGKKEVCKLDSAGIPRCFGGGSTECPTGYTGEAPCCIDEGAICQFRDQCCSDLLCVPDESGVLRCTSSGCIPLGSVCDPSAGDPCCEGECLSNDAEFVCQEVGACIPNGETCITAADCCSGECVDSTCGAASTCQAAGEVCTSDGDCCGGLSCMIPAGSLSGTCEQDTSDCSVVGQSCSSADPCCAGYLCVIAGTFDPCDDTGCTCWAPPD